MLSREHSTATWACLVLHRCDPVRVPDEDYDDLQDALQAAMRQLQPQLTAAGASHAAAVSLHGPGKKRGRPSAARPPSPPALVWKALPAACGTGSDPTVAAGWHVSLSPTLLLRAHEVSRIRKELEGIAARSRTVRVHTLAARVFASLKTYSLFLAAQVEPCTDVEELQASVSSTVQRAGQAVKPPEDVWHVSLARCELPVLPDASAPGHKRDRAVMESVPQHSLAAAAAAEEAAGRLDELADMMPWVGMCAFDVCELVLVAGKDVWRMPLGRAGGSPSPV